MSSRVIKEGAVSGPLSDDQKEHAVRLYLGQTRSGQTSGIQTIAQLTGYPRKMIEAALDEYGIERRKPLPLTNLALKPTRAQQTAGQRKRQAAARAYNAPIYT